MMHECKKLDPGNLDNFAIKEDSLTENAHVEAP